MSKIIIAKNINLTLKLSVKIYDAVIVNYRLDKLHSTEQKINALSCREVGNRCIVGWHCAVRSLSWLNHGQETYYAYYYNNEGNVQFYTKSSCTETSNNLHYKFSKWLDMYNVRIYFWKAVIFYPILHHLNNCIEAKRTL